MATQQFTGKHVIFSLIAFFGVIVIANAIFLTLAIRSFPGDSDDDAYLRGLDYNEVIAERSAQAALGWQAEVIGISDDGAIEVIVVDRDERPIDALRIVGKLQRPANDGSDIDLTFMYDGAGAYRSTASGAVRGVWDLKARAVNADGDDFDFNARVIIE